MKLGRRLLFLSLLIAALAPAGAAAAELRTYLSTEEFFPSGELSGPANNFPGEVEVSGVAGTVIDVNLTTIDFGANDDLDMALVGPNGAEVMLMSDACSTFSASAEYWTFDDEATESVPSGSCKATSRHARLRPTNTSTASDGEFATFGGPEGPFSTSLSSFDGISPNGDWELFLVDDNSAEKVGFEANGFALEIEVQPPPPTVQTVLVPGPTITIPGPTKIVTVPANTGKRAAALAKCKSKATAKARAKCKAKARQLPV